MIEASLSEARVDKPSKKITSLEGEECLNQLLRLAVEQEQPTLIKGILDLGADPHCIYEDKFTPLSLCARHQALDCFEILHSKDAPLDKKKTMCFLHYMQRYRYKIYQ